MGWFFSLKWMFLGMENNFKTYQNQYSSNTLALNKHQHNEERDKRRYLSHKFSLTQLSEFKWNGAVVGRKNLVINTLIMTITQLENNIPSAFLHPHWPLHRQNWSNAVQLCRSPADFGLALSILEACMKPVLFNPVWTEALGWCHVFCKWKFLCVVNCADIYSRITVKHWRFFHIRNTM